MIEMKFERNSGFCSKIWSSVRILLFHWEPLINYIKFRTDKYHYDWYDKISWLEYTSRTTAKSLSESKSVGSKLFNVMQCLQGRQLKILKNLFRVLSLRTISLINEYHQLPVVYEIYCQYIQKNQSEKFVTIWQRWLNLIKFSTKTMGSIQKFTM